VQSLIDMFDALGRIYVSETVARVPKDLPLLIFSGEEDPIHEGGRGLDKLVAGYGAAGLEKVDLRTYERGRHEMFNETNRDEVVSDLITWLDELVPNRHQQ
jgi:alpha-beta hydrolase superfamily lysophospholipase